MLYPVFILGSAPGVAALTTICRCEDALHILGHLHAQRSAHSGMARAGALELERRWQDGVQE